MSKYILVTCQVSLTAGNTLAGKYSFENYATDCVCISRSIEDTIKYSIPKNTPMIVNPRNKKMIIAVWVRTIKMESLRE